jgi:hypothetical protein
VTENTTWSSQIEGVLNKLSAATDHIIAISQERATHGTQIVNGWNWPRTRITQQFQYLHNQKNCNPVIATDDTRKITSNEKLNITKYHILGQANSKNQGLVATVHSGLRPMNTGRAENSENLRPFTKSSSQQTTITRSDTLAEKTTKTAPEIFFLFMSEAKFFFLRALNDSRDSP